MTVAVVTKPYDFEGSKRMLHAEQGIEALSEWVDSLIVIPNEKLAEVYGDDNSIFSSFENANDVMRGIHGAEFILANTDSQALRDIKGATIIQIGSEITKGLGAGADPEKGREAALEAKEELSSAIEGADMLFIAAGMGGGTGTGAEPVIAQIARDLGILTVAVVTKPFEFEGPERMSNAQEGIDNLEQWVD